ncbi:hypothetical protein chiPu_0027902 [Chiloscyllium punctatum]|uniref:Uncharacterized protein n=1 Tax=Chiloscyllium punctatum TaxID=137246 RepID=A0A401TML6_CHIPU|nr:hypothetical protein [Chiloscyllium punctatum]
MVTPGDITCPVHGEVPLALGIGSPAELPWGIGGRAHYTKEERVKISLLATQIRSLAETFPAQLPAPVGIGPGWLDSGEAGLEHRSLPLQTELYPEAEVGRELGEETQSSSGLSSCCVQSPFPMPSDWDGDPFLEELAGCESMFEDWEELDPKLELGEELYQLPAGLLKGQQQGEDRTVRTGR